MAGVSALMLVVRVILYVCFFSVSFFMFFMFFLFFRFFFFFFFSSRRRHTRYIGDWSSDVCSSDLVSDILTFLVIVHPPTRVHTAKLPSNTSLPPAVVGTEDSAYSLPTIS